jgi:hypothetical protein
MTENRPADRRCGAVELGRLHTLRLVDARQLRAVEVAKSLPVSTALVMPAFRFFAASLA